MRCLCEWDERVMLVEDVVGAGAGVDGIGAISGEGSAD